MKKKWKYSNILLPAFVGALCCVACPAGAMAAENAGERAQTILEQQARTYPNAYFEATDNAQLSPEILAVWWEAFDDPILTELVTMTLADSPDLKAAQSRVNQARAWHQQGTAPPMAGCERQLDAHAGVGQCPV